MLGSSNRSIKPVKLGHRSIRSFSHDLSLRPLIRSILDNIDFFIYNRVINKISTELSTTLDIRDPGGLRDTKENRDNRGLRSYHRPRDIRDPGGLRESRDTRPIRGLRGLRGPGDLRETIDLRESSTIDLRPPPI